MVIKLDIKTNIMANNKTITIEHIIGKLDNDFNPDGSDWILEFLLGVLML